MFNLQHAQHTEPLVYSVHEAAKALSTTEAGVRNMIAQKKLAVQKTGHRVFISREAILDYLRGRIVR